MSEFNLIWRKYGLNDNPFFDAPLTIEGGTLTLSSFIGREEERQSLKRTIEMGGEVRYMVIGEPGVGKTSLVNYVRDEASKHGFFTPIREIEINKVISANEFIILTMSAIYDEVKRKEMHLNQKLTEKLDALYELTKFGELSYDIANLTQLNKLKLMELFRELIKEVVHPRFKGIILHYDNLDNIQDFEGLLDLISEIRDFLLNKNVVFIFVGDSILPSIIMLRRQVSSIFIMPPLEVNYFSFEEIKQIINERIEKLKIGDEIPVTIPYEEKCIETLFDLYGGNIREILNSLASCIQSLPTSNIPIQITDDILRDILFKKVNESYLTKLSDVEKSILSKILDVGIVTPTHLSTLTKKALTNISSKYLPKLVLNSTVRLKKIEGRYKYYEVVPEIKWWKLQRTENQKLETKIKIENKVKRIVDKSLREFIY